jgi:hypothetical protein
MKKGLFPVNRKEEGIPLRQGAVIKGTGDIAAAFIGVDRHFDFRALRAFFRVGNELPMAEGSGADPVGPVPAGIPGAGTASQDQGPQQGGGATE